MCEKLITTAAPCQDLGSAAGPQVSVCRVPSAPPFQCGARYQALPGQLGADRASESDEELEVALDILGGLPRRDQAGETKEPGREGSPKLGREPHGLSPASLPRQFLGLAHNFPQIALAPKGTLRSRAPLHIL